jgi:membrane protein
VGRLASLGSFVLVVAHEATDQEVKYPAAAIAYYGFVSVVPLLLLVIAVGGTLLGPDVLDALDEFTPQYLTPDARRLVGEAVVAASGRTGAVVLAIGVIAWSAANAAIAFLDTIERVESVDDRSILGQLRDATVVLASLALAALATVATSLVVAVLSVVPLGPLSPAATLYAPIVLFALLTLAFLPLYYVPSRVVTTPLGAMPGAATAAAGWTLLQIAVQFYATNAGQYALYGVISGIIVVLTALYAAAIVLTLGAVVNATLSGVGEVGEFSIE